MLLTFKDEKVGGYRFPITKFALIDSLPKCENCQTEIHNNQYARYCENKVFFCESCFTMDFNAEHWKTYHESARGMMVHNDLLVFVRLIPTALIKELSESESNPQFADPSS